MSQRPQFTDNVYNVENCITGGLCLELHTGESQVVL